MCFVSSHSFLATAYRTYQIVYVAMQQRLCSSIPYSTLSIFLTVPTLTSLSSDSTIFLGNGIRKSFLEIMEGYMLLKRGEPVDSSGNEPVSQITESPLSFDPKEFKANKEVGTCRDNLYATQG